MFSKMEEQQTITRERERERERERDIKEKLYLIFLNLYCDARYGVYTSKPP